MIQSEIGSDYVVQTVMRERQKPGNEAFQAFRQSFDPELQREFETWRENKPEENNIKQDKDVTKNKLEKEEKLQSEAS